jgi:hypothetical protein
MAEFMKMILKQLIIVALLTLAIGLVVSFAPKHANARRPVTKMKLHGELKSELNAVLKATVELQEASFKRNDKQVSQNLKRLITRIDLATKKANLAKDQRTHIQKLLGTAKLALEKSRKAAGADRQTFLQKAFKQMVTLSQAYQLESYKMFFCPKDKSIWLQRGSKPQNPINPGTHGNCGKQVT